MHSRGNSNGISLVIRYDDYGAAYSGSCAARLAVEEMLHRETVAHGWPWVNAVTPRQSVDTHNVHELRTVSLSEDPTRIALLRDMAVKGFCEPAVHGLTHHTWKQLPKYGTEFAGRPLGEQVEILRTAKSDVEAFSGRPVSVFVPPWNSYDATSVKAAGEAGLTLLSGGLVTYVGGQSPVTVVPSTVELIHLRQIMDRGCQYPSGSVLVILLHGTDFVIVDKEIGYLQLDEFAPLVARAVSHFGAQVVPITHVPEQLNGDLEYGSTRATKMLHCHRRLTELPLIGESLRDWSLPHVSALLPRANAAGASRSLSAAIGAWFFVVAMLALAPGLLLLAVPQTNVMRTGITGVIGLFGLLLTAHSARNAYRKRVKGMWGTHIIGFRTWTSLTIGLSLIASAILPWLVNALTGGRA